MWKGKQFKKNAISNKHKQSSNGEVSAVLKDGFVVLHS